ncbi:MAG TPA: DUF2235 domain-containing protein [Pseudonocardiaceae bacterium]|nr:DUF2235 domain-containing protein [Pseudonocardiaceae bacterium]
MRHLVVCCDGTWNTPEQKQGGVPAPTNVVRLYHALVEDENQRRYYHPGVGTDPGLIDRLRGGGLGVGLDANIKSGYSWLATNYQPGDAICLFGFSRGAYTVRSLAGMISTCGLATTLATELPATRWAEIDRLYDQMYRPAEGRSGGRRPYPSVPIRLVGVWDTVGSLGIPDNLGVLNLFDVDDRHKFHNTELSSIITHARHAVALDERRGPFTPTLWTSETPEPGTGRSIKQVWFPGDHCDVGGGHRETGLSDRALQWMVKEAIECAGLRFREEILKHVQPDPTDVLHDLCTGLFLYLDPAPRAVPLIDGKRSADVVDESAFARQDAPPITTGDYWPSEVLGVGETARREVYAGERWNATGLYLEEGEYVFHAEGEWLDGDTAVGPGGTRDGRFHPSEVFQLAGSFAGWAQERFRQLSRNDAAAFFGAARVTGAPWMALIGVIAARDEASDDAQRPYRPFVIGKQCQQKVLRPGYFYAFANDAWSFYSNNKGSVTLFVKRLS